MIDAVNLPTENIPASHTWEKLKEVVVDLSLEYHIEPDAENK